MIRIADERSIWWSRSDSVCAGATTIESPVCTPIGSRFSMLQTVMHVSAPSRMTSYSISFQPHSDRSIRTWWMGDAARPRAATSSRLTAVVTKPPPVPPSVYAGRMTSGSPACDAKSLTSSIDSHTRETGTGSPMSSSICLNAWRSSALRIVSIVAPSSRTWWRSSTPALARSVARLSPVCPPSVGSRASGCSRAMIRSTDSTVNGSRYTRSATSSGHDRRRVGVDQHDLDPFLTQRLARLRTRVVELCGLADDDGTGAEDKDLARPRLLRHPGHRFYDGGAAADHVNEAVIEVLVVLRAGA